MGRLSGPWKWSTAAQKAVGLYMVAYLEKCTRVCSGNHRLTGYSTEVCNGEMALAEDCCPRYCKEYCSTVAVAFQAGGVPWNTASAIYFCHPNYSRVLSCWSLSQAKQIWMKGVSMAVMKNFKTMWYSITVS